MLETSQVCSPNPGPCSRLPHGPSLFLWCSQPPGSSGGVGTSDQYPVMQVSPRLEWWVPSGCGCLWEPGRGGALEEPVIAEGAKNSQ